jgi:hypothetical protein
VHDRGKQAMARQHKGLRDLPCAFCAGTRAGTVDHVPNIGLFPDRRRPKGLEVPACERCNRGSRWAEDIAALLAAIRMDGALLEHFERKIAHVAKTQPRALLEMQSSPSQDLRAERWADAAGEPAAALNVTGPIVGRAMRLFGAKLGMALHWHETGRPLPAHGRIVVQVFSNEQAFEGRIPQALFDFLPDRRTLEQGKLHVRDVFEYSSRETEEGGHTAHWATFGQSFMFYLFLGPNLAWQHAPTEDVFMPGCLQNSEPIDTVLSSQSWPDSVEWLEM